MNGEVGSTATIPTVLPCGAQMRGQPVDQRGLARPRRAGHADHERAARVREERGQERRAPRAAVLDEADGPRHGPHVAREHAAREVRRDTFSGPSLRCSSSRAMTRRWTSLVPSPIVPSLLSRR